MFPAAKRILLPSWLLALWIVVAAWMCLPDAAKNCVWKNFCYDLQTSLQKVAFYFVTQQDKASQQSQLASELSIDPDGRFGKAAFQGATQGDFYNPTNTAQTWGKGFGQFVTGLVPYYGQAADVRDMGAAINTARTEGLNWRTGTGVAMAGVAFIPGVGDAIRSGVKPLLGSPAGQAGVKALHGGPASAVAIPEVRISASKYPELAQNITHAQKAGHPSVLTHGGNPAVNRPGALEGVPNIRPLSRDEYPFASSLEGGASSWVGHVPVSQQNAQGAILKNFFKQNNIKPGDQYRVIIDP